MRIEDMNARLVYTMTSSGQSTDRSVFSPSQRLLRTHRPGGMEGLPDLGGNPVPRASIRVGVRRDSRRLIRTVLARSQVYNVAYQGGCLNGGVDPISMRF